MWSYTHQIQIREKVSIWKQKGKQNNLEENLEENLHGLHVYFCILKFIA